MLKLNFRNILSSLNNRLPPLVSNLKYSIFNNKFTPNTKSPIPPSSSSSTPSSLTSPLSPQSSQYITRNILITAALPYVNNTPHLGNIIGGILSADCYARYCRLRNYNVLFISGTDQYGTTTQVKALKQHTTPYQICQKYHNLHSQIYRWFNIQFDYFGRTSNPTHTTITQQIFWKLYQRGYADKRNMKQFYCQGCQLALADRFVVGECGRCGGEAKGDQCQNCGVVFKEPIQELKQPKCSICRRTPVVKNCEHLYFKLSQNSQNLKKWLIDDNGMANWTNNAKAVTKAQLNNGIQDRCVTRVLKWGVPVPQNYLSQKRVFYVWFQAPIGYISITAGGIGQKWRSWWQPNPQHKVQLNQFMGKDNIAFHSIMAPATLESTGVPYVKPKRLSVTEYLKYQGGKFSKSNNIGVFGDDCQKTGIKSDVWRYFLLLNRPEVYDTQFLWQDLANTNKKDLMNVIGNMILRILKYTHSNLNNKIPEIKPQQYTALQTKVIQQFTTLIQKYCTQLQSVQIKAGCHTLLQIGQIFNKYIQQSQFWNKKHVQNNRNKLIIAVSIRLLQFYAVLMDPYLPSTCDDILSTLSLTPLTVNKFMRDKLPHEYFKQIMTNPIKVQKQNQKWRNVQLLKPQILFQDIHEKKIKELISQFGHNRNELKEQLKVQKTSKQQQKQNESEKKKKKEEKKKQKQEKKQKRKQSKQSEQYKAKLNANKDSSKNTK